jgi:hypothetical protein
VDGLKQRITKPGHPWQTLLGVVVVAGLALFLVLWGLSGGDDDVRAEARTAYCLQATNRPRLVEVAINLRKIHRGSTTASVWPSTGSRRWVTLDTWSGDANGGFNRACDVLAVIAAPKLSDSEPGPAWYIALLRQPTVTLVLGAALTYLVGLRTARRENRRALAGALSTAVAEYTAAAIAHTAERHRAVGGVDTTAIDTRRAELLVAVQYQPVSPDRKASAIDRLDQAHQLVIGPQIGPSGAHDAEVEKKLAGLRASLMEMTQGRMTVPAAVSGAGS